MKFICITICALTMITLATTLSAQKRVTDLEAFSVSPAGSVINGKSLLLRFGYINHGPDNEIPRDTTLYMLFRRYDNGREEVVYQGMMQGSEGVDSGKKGMYIDNYGITFNIPNLKEPLTLDFCVTLFTDVLMDNGDSLNLNRHDPNLSNNTSCQKVTIYPKPTDASNIDDESNLAFQIYPNPAQNEIKLKLTEDLQNDGIVTISNSSGRIVFKQDYNRKHLKDGTLSLNIGTLPTGIFLVTLQSPTKRFVKKLTVIK